MLKFSTKNQMKVNHVVKDKRIVEGIKYLRVLCRVNPYTVVKPLQGVVELCEEKNFAHIFGMTQRHCTESSS